MDNFKKLSMELNAFIENARYSSMKEPVGNLKYKFLDPGAMYKNLLWDWDSYFCAISLCGIPHKAGEHLQGCIYNFLGNMKKDYSVPFVISANGNGITKLNMVEMGEEFFIDEVRKPDDHINNIKPILAQMCLIASNYLDDYKWLEKVFIKLKYYIEHWENTQKTDLGLFVWRSHRGTGTDNHPAVYGRPLNSSAGVDLNCLMYREYTALGKIAQILGEKEAEETFINKSVVLKELINKYMWDPIDEIYYHLDMGSRQPENTTQKVTWVVPLKFKAWTAFMPMWIGIAPEAYAEKMVKKHLLNPDEFWSSYGVRSLAKNEPSYCIFSGGNPSDWQGPIWVVSNYLIFRGLMNYKYKEEAKTLAENLLMLLVEKDLKVNGQLSEYYHPETGEALCNPGFLNWNMLAGIMYEEYVNEKDFTAF